MEKTINHHLNSLRCTIAPFCFLTLLNLLFFAGHALAVDPDPYEPDNVFSEANVIVLYNDTPHQLNFHEHNFHVAGDQDWVKFYGLSGISYSVKVSNLGVKCDAVVELYDTDGVTMVAGPQDNGWAGVDERLDWPCTKDGVYYAKVAQFDQSVFGDNTEYNLEVIYPDGPPFPGFLDGMVTDAVTKLPIPDVLIKTDHNFSTMTDSDGIYSMVHRAGIYLVIVQAAGYVAMDFSVEISEGGTVLHDIELIPLASVSPDIKANGQDGPITVSPTTPLAITISLDSGGDAGQHADWWIVESTPSGSLNYFDLGSGSMVQGFFPTNQGPLFGFGTIPLLNLSTLETGVHTFYFAVDLNMNGLLDVDSLYFDWVNIHVAE